MNHFELFSFEPSLDIDLSALKERFLHLQRTTHPDKFAHLDSQQQRLAVQKNAQLNDAYQILIDPVSRAEHLMQLKGFEVVQDSATIKEPAFLFQQMEWREEMDNIESLPSEQAEEAIEALMDSCNALRRIWHESFAEALAAEDEPQMQLMLQKLKFMNKLMPQLRQLEDKILDI